MQNKNDKLPTMPQNSSSSSSNADTSNMYTNSKGSGGSKVCRRKSEKNRSSRSTSQADKKVDREITELENLIKKLEKEIHVMAENAGKPKIKLASNVEEIVNGPVKANFESGKLVYPVSSEQDSILNARRNFKTLWNDPNPATTSNVIADNSVKDLQNDVSTKSDKNVKLKDNENATFHILTGYTVQSPLDNSSHSTPQLGAASNNSIHTVEVSPPENIEIVKNNESKDTPNKEENIVKAEINIENPKQSNTILSLLLHVFSKPSVEQKSSITENSVTESSEEPAKNVSATKNVTVLIDKSDPSQVPVKELVKNPVKNDSTNPDASTAIKKSNISLINPVTEFAKDPGISDSINPDSSTQGSKSIASSKNPVKELAKEPVKSDSVKLADITVTKKMNISKHPAIELENEPAKIPVVISITKPNKIDERSPVAQENAAKPNNNFETHNEVLVAESSESKLKNVYPTSFVPEVINIPKKIDNGTLTRKSLHTSLPKNPNSKAKIINIKHSTEILSENDIKTLPEVKDITGFKTDVPKRLSIINIYFDSCKPGHHRYEAKQSDSSITRVSEDKPLNEELKTPASDSIIDSVKEEVHNTKAEDKIDSEQNDSSPIELDKDKPSKNSASNPVIESAKKEMQETEADDKSCIKSYKDTENLDAQIMDDRLLEGIIEKEKTCLNTINSSNDKVHNDTDNKSSKLPVQTVAHGYAEDNKTTIDVAKIDNKPIAELSMVINLTTATESTTKEFHFTGELKEKDVSLPNIKEVDTIKETDGKAASSSESNITEPSDVLKKETPTVDQPKKSGVCNEDCNEFLAGPPKDEKTTANANQQHDEPEITSKGDERFDRSEINSADSASIDRNDHSIGDNSSGDVSTTNEDGTDEYESFGDDDTTSRESSVGNPVVVNTTDITVRSDSDVFEDSQDFMRHNSEIGGKKRQK